MKLNYLYAFIFTGIFMLIVMAIILSVLYEGVKFLRQYIHRDVKIAQ